NDFHIRQSGKLPSCRAQLRNQLAGVVDLAVAGEDEPSAGGDKRLSCRRPAIRERVLTMRKRNAGAGIAPKLAPVRTPVAQCIRHGVGDTGERFARLPCAAIPDSGNGGHSEAFRHIRLNPSLAVGNAPKSKQLIVSYAVSTRNISEGA